MLRGLSLLAKQTSEGFEVQNLDFGTVSNGT